MKLKEGIKEKNIVIGSGTDFVLPFVLVFGLYIITFGTVSPGGGFQGGVLTSFGLLLIYLGHGHKVLNQAVNMDVLETNDAIGAIIYEALAFCGIFLGARFCENVFFDNGAVGQIVSAGTITFMMYAVGFKVLNGVGFLISFMLGMLSEPDDDDEDEDGEEALGHAV